jgi:RNA polymerase sigma-70 factor (ECF subfamily)
MDDVPGAREFATTQWSLVVAAKPDEASQTQARMALEQLCRAYWFPLYAFVRSRGYSSIDAQDLTQSFFTRLIETSGFSGADPERGRFRSYLLGAMKHFLANEWHRNQAQKRGGGATFLELDGLEPEKRYALEPAQLTNPDERFRREWAQESIDRAMGRLRTESDGRGKAALFDAIKGCLVGEAPSSREIADRLGMSEGAVKVAVHRLRQRFREILRTEIAQTVSDPSEVDDEMRQLVNALRGK